MTPPGRRWNIAIGILLLARGRAEGLRYFDDTKQAVLSSLAPLAALLLVGVVLALASGAGPALLNDVLILAIGILGPLVLSYEIAQRWGRQAAWYRFAVAICWCNWAGPPVMMLLLFASTLLIAIGVPPLLAIQAGQIALVLYALWPYWFVVRHAMGLSRGRAALLVVLVNAGMIVLVKAPLMVANALQGG